MDCPLLDLFYPVDAADERTLSRSAWAADDHYFTLVDIFRDALKDMKIAEPFVDILYPYQR